MTTIPCPGQQRFAKRFTEFAYGVFSAGTSEAALSRVLAAIAREAVRLHLETSCANGCRGPYWRVIDQDAYVYECTRLWFTLWVVDRCEARGKLEVEANCSAFTGSDLH